MGILRTLFGPSDYEIALQNERNRIIQIIVESTEIFNNTKNIKTKIGREQTIWDMINILKQRFPDDEFFIENKNMIEELKKQHKIAKNTERVYDIIERGNGLYKQKDLGENYYKESMEYYKQAIDIIINPDIFIFGVEPPIQPFKRYIAYLKKQKKNEEIKQIQEEYQKLME